MIYRFNKAQLGRDLESNLDKLLENFQKTQDKEIEVVVADFPNKFSVEVGGETIAVVVLDAESAEYKFLDSAEPESEPEPEPVPEPQAKIDPVKLAQRTYQVTKDNLSLSPGQRKIYHDALCELWIKES